MTLLIFDCDGVLVDSEPLHAQVESEVGREILGIDREPLAHNLRFSGGGLKNLYKTWEQEYGAPLPPEVDAEIVRRKGHAFSTELKAIPHITDALTALADFPHCVASGTPLPTLTLSLKTTSLYDYFAPHFFTADMVKHGKPAPDIFLYAAAQMGFAPDDCIVIEDSLHGVNAALAAGMKVVGFVGGSHCQPGHIEKLQGATRLIKDMRELPMIVRELILSKKVASPNAIRHP